MARKKDNLVRREHMTDAEYARCAAMYEFMLRIKRKRRAKELADQPPNPEGPQGARP